MVVSSSAGSSPPNAMPARRRGRRSTPSTFSTANIFGLAPDGGDEGGQDGGAASEAGESVASSVTLSQDRARGGRRGGTLPSVPGVTGLLKSEAKRDIRQMEGWLTLMASQKRGAYDAAIADPGMRIAAQPPIPIDSQLEVKRRRFTQWTNSPEEIQADLKEQERVTCASRALLAQAQVDERVSSRGHSIHRQRVVSRRRAAKIALSICDIATEALERLVEQELGMGPRRSRRSRDDETAMTQALECLQAWGKEIESLLQNRSVLVALLRNAGAEGIDECAAIVVEEDVGKKEQNGEEGSSPDTLIDVTPSVGRTEAPIYITPLGVGELVEERPDDNVRHVRLAFGDAYFPREAKGLYPLYEEPSQAGIALQVHSVVASKFEGRDFLEDRDIIKRWAAVDANPFLEGKEGFAALEETLGGDLEAHLLEMQSSVPAKFEFEGGSLLSCSTAQVFEALGAPPAAIFKSECQLPLSAGDQQVPGLGRIQWAAGVLSSVADSIVDGKEGEIESTREKCSALLVDVNECTNAHRRAQILLAQSVGQMAEKASELAILRASVEEYKQSLHYPVTTRATAAESQR
jgi:hypothetical protein